MKTINGIKCRTRNESLKHIIEQTKAGKVGPKSSDQHVMFGDLCSYQYESGNNCAVGCLFTKEQLKWIDDRLLNNTDILDLSQRVSVENIEAVTGIPLTTLYDIQCEHDDILACEMDPEQRKIAQQKFIKYIESLLEESK